jgi:phosphoglycolate phosphatase-like HAD superfamily hydrolase
MPRLTVYLDDGGVMNDNLRRAAEWQRLVGDFFAPRLGGACEHWAQVNREVFEDVWVKSMLEQKRAGLTYHDWSRRYQTNWLRAMARGVGVEIPEDDEEVLGLALEAALYVTHRCQSYFADAPPAIVDLAGAGFRLCTASGEESQELDGYLRVMGVRDAFTHLFGPDLVDVHKEDGHLYYPRAFALAGQDPAEAVIVDDSPRALAAAATAGAYTVLVRRDSSRDTDGYTGAVINDLSDLPALVSRLEYGA